MSCSSSWYQCLTCGYVGQMFDEAAIGEVFVDSCVECEKAELLLVVPPPTPAQQLAEAKRCARDRWVGP